MVGKKIFLFLEEIAADDDGTGPSTGEYSSNSSKSVCLEDGVEGDFDDMRITVASQAANACTISETRATECGMHTKMAKPCSEGMCGY
jgi:hypothetical protein